MTDDVKNEVDAINEGYLPERDEDGNLKSAHEVKMEAKRASRFAMAGILRSSPKITADLFRALALVALNGDHRAHLEGTDPMGWKQVSEALAAADPEFPSKLDLARASAAERKAEAERDLAAQREAARLARGGFYVRVDGRPFCGVPSKIFSDVVAAGGRATCEHRTLAEAEALAAIVRRVSTGSEVEVVPGGCPRMED
jgi:hypothetical protein